MLQDKIKHRIVNYYLQASRIKAYKIAFAYLWLSKKETDEENIVSACFEGLYWLKMAGYPLYIKAIELDAQDLITMLERLVKIVKQELRHYPWNRTALNEKIKKGLTFR